MPNASLGCDLHGPRSVLEAALQMAREHLQTGQGFRSFTSFYKVFSQVWQNLLLYFILYFSLSLTYRLLLSDSGRVSGRLPIMVFRVKVLRLLFAVFDLPGVEFQC